MILATFAVASGTITAFALSARFAMESVDRLPVPAAHGATTSPFLYTFDDEGTLHEVDRMDLSTSPYWWLSSGGKMIMRDGIGMTVQGNLGAFEKWRLAYARSNPGDTGSGFQPQNVFRLVSRYVWRDVATEVAFRIRAVNALDSPNRNESNGILLMSRYIDSDNLYYAGLRVNGHAVIKKKQDGTYTTLAETPVFASEYDRESSANLIPVHEWIHVRSETFDDGDAVIIRLFMRRDGESEWQRLLTARDTETPLHEPGHIGIRTDFFDVGFENFRAVDL